MADDYASNTSTTGYLSPGSQAKGTLEAINDSDWFRISLTAGKFYSFELALPLSNTYYQFLQILDAQGNYLSGSSGSSGGVIKATFKANFTGDYYVTVRDQSFPSNYTPLAYTLKASTGVMDDVGDTRATAKTVTVGQKTSAMLEIGSDVDYFKFAAQAGVTYTITPGWTLNGGSSSGSIRVEDPNGSWLGTYNPSGNSSFTATSTGDYYFVVSNSYGPITNYDVTVAKATDDHAANQTGAGQLTVGAAASTGTLEVTGDRDWYGVELKAATTYWFTLGGNGGSTAYGGSGGMLKLIAEDGTVVATSSGYTSIGPGTSLLLQHVPSVGGKYYLEVSDSSYRTGIYEVSAKIGEADDYGNTQADAFAVSAGTPVQGKLAIPQDTDMFKLSVTAGKTYLVALTGTNLSSGTTLSLNGYSADYYNNLLSYNKGGIDQYRVLTANTTGDFYFAVGTNGGQGTGSYKLAITEPAVDDYASGQSTSGVLDVGGKATGVLDFTGDVDTFKVTLQYGAKYAFQLRGAGSGEGSLPLTNVMLQIAAADAANGAYLSAGQDGIYTFTSTVGGDYYVSVSPQNGYYGSTEPALTGSYALYARALSDDQTAPTLVSHAPTTNVGPLDNIVLRFSEAIMRGSSSSNASITLRDSTGTPVESYYQNSSQLTISGDTLTINPGVSLKPGTQYLLSLPVGAVTDLAGNNLAATELLSFETVRTVTAGTSGNDYMVGLGQGVKLSGGGGVDTAIYAGDRSNFDVARTATGATVTSKGWSTVGNAGDTLDSIERLQFSYTSVALDIDGTAGQAYRLYRAAFDRAPDSVGIGFWIKQMDNGMPLLNVAREFLNSSEFSARYGASLDDSGFVTKLYQNVLHRAPDQAGFDNWLGALAGGTDRANVLVDFSESKENQAAVLQIIGNGFEYTPYG